MGNVIAIIKNIPVAVVGFLQLLHVGIHNSVIPLIATTFSIVVALILAFFTLFPGLAEDTEPKDFSNVNITRCKITKELATYDTEIAYRIVCPK